MIKTYMITHITSRHHCAGGGHAGGAVFGTASLFSASCVVHVHLYFVTILTTVINTDKSALT